MNAQPVAPAPAPAAAPAIKPTIADRASALKAKLDAEPEPTTSEAAADPAAPEGAPPTPDVPADAPAVASGAAAPPIDEAAAKVREERLARIAAVREKELADDAERQKFRAGKDRDKEVEQLRAKLAEYEPLNGVFASEESLLAEAEKRGMSAEKLVQWMRTRLTDPAAVAQRQAKTEADKLREEMAKDRAELAALKEQLAQQATQAREQYESQAKAMTFLQKTQASTASHPLTARLLERHGPHGFVQLVNAHVAQHLPEGYSVEQLHDEVEQFLDNLGGGGGASPAPAQPANGASQAPAKKNGEAQPATTLSNALTAERATLTEEKPLSRLPLKERERLLKEKLARE